MLPWITLDICFLNPIFMSCSSFSEANQKCWWLFHNPPQKGISVINSITIISFHCNVEQKKPLQWIHFATKSCFDSARKWNTNYLCADTVLTKGQANHSECFQMSDTSYESIKISLKCVRRLFEALQASACIHSCPVLIDCHSCTLHSEPAVSFLIQGG